MKLKTGYKLAVVVFMVAGATFLTVYFHLVLKTETIFTHLFYIPIILAAIWWTWKGLLVAVYLSLLLTTSDAFLLKKAMTADNYYRAAMFIVIGVVVAALSSAVSKRERKLEASEQRYRTLLESLNEGIVALDNKNNITFVNERMAEMLGYPQERIVGRSLFDFMDERGEELARRDLERHRSGIIERADYEFEGSEGKRVLAIAATATLGDGAGNPVGTITGIMDVTQRREAEIELARYREQLEDLVAERTAELYRLGMAVEQSIDGIAITDLDGYFQFVNNSWAAMHRYKASDLVGKHLVTCYTDRQMDVEVNPFLAQVMRAGVNQGELAHCTSDGRIFPTWTTASLLTKDNREAVGFAIAARDITERKRAEDELQQINAQLEGFAHTVSHDLKGPLGSIMASSILMQELLESTPSEGSTGQLRELADIINSGVGKAEVLIEELLSLAEAGQRPDKVCEVDVGEVVEGVLEERVAELSEKKTQVRIDPALGTVRANPTQVYQLFSNLVGNAIKHNDSIEPQLTVRRLEEEREGFHRFVVRDNGSGIPPDQLDKIFTPFFKGNQGSMGIGLSIVERILDIYRGHIEAYNDQGACFEFTIKDLD